MRRDLNHMELYKQFYVFNLNLNPRVSVSCFSMPICSQAKVYGLLSVDYGLCALTKLASEV